jgi:hypothetical protein
MVFSLSRQGAKRGFSPKWFSRKAAKAQRGAFLAKVAFSQSRQGAKRGFSRQSGFLAKVIFSQSH